MVLVNTMWVQRAYPGQKGRVVICLPNGTYQVAWLGGEHHGRSQTYPPYCLKPVNAIDALAALGEIPRVPW